MYKILSLLDKASMNSINKSSNIIPYDLMIRSGKMGALREKMKAKTSKNPYVQKALEESLNKGMSDFLAKTLDSEQLSRLASGQPADMPYFMILTVKLIFGFFQ